MTNSINIQKTGDLHFRLQNILHKNMDDATFDNLQLAEQLKVSERQLFRKMKELTGLPPRKYIRNYRLDKAMRYMKFGQYRTVNEIAYAIGYTNVSYFITQFEKRYNKKPLQILQENGWR